MPTENPQQPRADLTPMAELERTLIAEYLREHGHDVESVHRLPEAEAHKLLRDASVYASGKLEEVESRAHYVHDLHGDVDVTR